MRSKFSTPQRRRFLIVVVCLSITLTGCVGWGANGPVDGSNADQENSTDLENEQNNANGSEGTSDSSNTNNNSHSEPQSTTTDHSSNDSSSNPSDTTSPDSSNNSGSTDSPVDDLEDNTTAGNEPGNGDSGDTTGTETNNDRDSNNSSNANNGNDSDSNNPEMYTLRVFADTPITIERTSDGTTTTREPTNGSAKFTVLEGQYNVMVDGYNEPMTPISVSEDRTVTLQEGGSITITVVNAETGDPVKGAEISGMCNLWYSGGDAYITGNSNVNGVIEAATITPTTCQYDVYITADGYENTSISKINVPEDDGMTVELHPENN